MKWPRSVPASSGQSCLRCNLGLRSQSARLPQTLNRLTGILPRTGRLLRSEHSALSGGTSMSSVASEVRSGATWSIVLSILMIVTGFLAIAAPMMAGAAITAIVGWLLVFSGAMHLLFAWRGGHAAAIIWEILLGLVYMAIGV